MPPSKVPEMTRAVGRAVAPAELGNTVVRPVPPPPPPPPLLAVVVAALVVVLAVVRAVVRVVVGAGLPDPGTHWEL